MLQSHQYIPQCSTGECIQDMESEGFPEQFMAQSKCESKKLMFEIE